MAVLTLSCSFFVQVCIGLIPRASMVLKLPYTWVMALMCLGTPALLDDESGWLQRQEEEIAAM